MSEHEIRIFVSNTIVDSEWYITALGTIVKPAIEKFEDELEYYWFLHYDYSATWSDADHKWISSLNRDYDFLSKNNTYRSIKLRFAATNKRNAKKFYEHLKSLAANYNCISTPLTNYQPINDIGNKRFCYNDLWIDETTQSKPKQKQIKELKAHRKDVAFLMTDVMYSWCRMFLFYLRKNECMGFLNHPAFYLSTSPEYINKIVSPLHLICNSSNIYFDQCMYNKWKYIKRTGETWNWALIKQLPERIKQKIAYNQLKKTWNL